MHVAVDPAGNSHFKASPMQSVYAIKWASWWPPKRSMAFMSKCGLPRGIPRVPCANEPPIPWTPFHSPLSSPPPNYLTLSRELSEIICGKSVYAPDRMPMGIITFYCDSIIDPCRRHKAAVKSPVDSHFHFDALLKYRQWQHPDNSPRTCTARNGSNLKLG